MSTLTSPTSCNGDAPIAVAVVAGDRTDIESLLQPAGVRIEAYDDAESFLRHGSARTVAFAIIDVALPGMSGLDLLRRLRDAGLGMPVIVVAAESDVPTAVSAMRAGATDFIERPLVEWAVLRQVNAVLQSRGDGGSRPA
jgi:FixJ family two-component response regulator